MTFVEELARRSFALHLMMTLRLIEEMSIELLKQHNNYGCTEREVEAISLAVQLMIIERLLQQET